MKNLKYYDVHVIVNDDCKSGYSIFIAAASKDDALNIIRCNSLYEELEDLNNIDYIGEISEEEYKAAF